MDDYIRYGRGLYRYNEGPRYEDDFLKRLLKNIRDECEDFYDYTGDLPFLYSELQMHSMLLPALRRNHLCHTVFMEKPVTRSRKLKGKGSRSDKGDKRGRLDFWVLKSNKTAIAIKTIKNTDKTSRLYIQLLPFIFFAPLLSFLHIYCGSCPQSPRASDGHGDQHSTSPGSALNRFSDFLSPHHTYPR